MLLAYLPTTRLEHITNKAAQRRALANLFYACLSHILHPLQEAGINGIIMATGHGVCHHCHPIFACFVGDYPEQMLTVCCKHGECPECTVPHDKLGDNQRYAPRDLINVLNALELADRGGTEFTQACAKAGIKPVYHPFWEKLPYVNIFRSITPDILHQLYQGVLKHVIIWLKAAFGTTEIDA
jgi:hypothetical protein